MTTLAGALNKGQTENHRDPECQEERYCLESEKEKHK